MAIPRPPVRYRAHHLLGVTLVLAASLAGAQTPAPAGAEFQVNSYTTLGQALPSVAAVGTSGGFVVAWRSNGQDGSAYGIFGQRFGSNGTAQGAEFQVNSYTAGEQRAPSVAGLGPSGDFVVAWHSKFQDDPLVYGIFGQRFGSDGTQQGAEFQVNSYTTGNQRYASLAGVGTSGDFVVAWHSTNQDGSSYGVFGQRFDSAGVKQGAEFQVNSYTTNEQGYPSVTRVGMSGDFVVAWYSQFQDGNSPGVFGQRFGSDGTKQGSEFHVNSYTLFGQAAPSVAGVGTSGDFVVAWSDTSQDGHVYGIFGQRFGSDGTREGAEFQVNSYTTGTQREPSVAGLGTSGDFLVAWYSFQDGGGSGTFGQRFGSDGTKQGAEFQVNSYTTNNQESPSVAPLGTSGDFVVAWYSNQEGAGLVGIFAQRFAGPAPAGTVTVSAPGSTKDAWGTGTVQRIRAEHDMGSSASFDIAISRDAGSTFPESIATGVASAANGTAMNFDWTVSAGTAGTPQTAAVRVSRNGAPSINDDSTTVVISGPFINVERPRNTVKVSANPFKIVWLHNLGYRRPFKIELAKNGSTFDQVIAASTLSQWAWRGEFLWSPALPADACTSPGSCVVKITSLDPVATSNVSISFNIQ